MRARWTFVSIAWLWFGAVGTGGDLPRERIVYTTLRPANWELYLFDHGAAPKQLTNDPALDYDPTFSPDGRWIVFCSERSGNPQLYALDPDKTDPPTRHVVALA